MGITEIITWGISVIVSLLGLAKTGVETKKLLEKTVVPDIKIAETAEEINRKQELARALVQLTAIESAYNIARGLVLALHFGMLTYVAYRYAAYLRESLTKGNGN